MNFSSRLGKYLGTHIDPGRNKQIVYDQVLSNVQRRTATWKNQLLSQASRFQLIRSVLSSANIYLLTCIRLPNHICQQIDALLVNFFWGESDETKKMHLLGKHVLFQRVNSGGLGMRDTS